MGNEAKANGTEELLPGGCEDNRQQGQLMLLTGKCCFVPELHDSPELLVSTAVVRCAQPQTEPLFSCQQAVRSVD